MRITELLVPGGVVELQGTTAEAVLSELAAPVARATRLDPTALGAALAARERLSSTGVGDGVAIPHARIPALPGLVTCLGRSRAGVDFRAHDGRKVHLLLALFAPEGAAGTHLQALAKASRIFKGAAFREAAVAAPDVEALRALLVAEDAKG